MLNIGFYSDALTNGQQYGLSRYASELFRSLHGLNSDLTVRPISAHAALPPSQLESLRQEHHYQKLPWPRRWTAAAWTLTGRPLLEHWAPWIDVVHCVELDYRIATNKPLVVTIHDIGPLTHPEFFGSAHPWLLKAALQATVRRADAIICVSQATAEAVEGYLNESLGDRLRVIAEGVSEEFFNSDQPPPSCLPPSNEPFFLWAGSLNPRKNLARVVAAFELIASKIPHRLVITGGVGWDADDSLARAQRSGHRHRIHLVGRVTDDELRGLYRRASAFVYASLMEGFGLPILEAMASHCPVITSNLSSMPEVAGDAAFLVDPENVEEIAQAMECLATDDGFAGRLRHKGRARAEDFRWETCAEAVAETYRQVAQSSRRGQRRTVRLGQTPSSQFAG